MHSKVLDSGGLPFSVLPSFYIAIAKLVRTDKIERALNFVLSDVTPAIFLKEKLSLV